MTSSAVARGRVLSSSFSRSYHPLIAVTPPSHPNTEQITSTTTTTSAPMLTILRWLKLTPSWLGADTTPSRKNRYVTHALMCWLDVHILCIRMCRTFLLKIYQLQYSSYYHYCSSLPWSRVDTWSGLDFHLPAQSDSAIDCCDCASYDDASPGCKWSLWGWHISPSEFVISAIYSVQVRIIYFEWHVFSNTTHHMSHPSLWYWCVVALYLLICCLEIHDFPRSLHRWSPVIVYLIDLSINNMSACWDHPYISSNIILLARLLQSKSWFISTALKWHVCSQQAIILSSIRAVCFDPMSRDCYGISLSMRLCRLWHIDISDDCRLLPSSSLSWESLTYTYVKFWYWYHLSSSISLHDSYQLYGGHVLHISSQGSFGSL